MYLIKAVGYSLGVLSLCAAVAHADNFSTLSPDEQNTINSGGQVIHTLAVNGSAWPSITVFQRVEATPDQVAAVMFDYPLHKSMFDGITQSDPETPGAAATDVHYTMTLPKVLGISLPDEHYIVHDVLSAMTGGGYQVAWTFVSATSDDPAYAMKDCSGNAQFESLGTGALISYTNFINPPKPTLAKLIVKVAVSRVEDTVTALGKQTVSEVTGDATAQAQLNAQLAALSKALGR